MKNFKITPFALRKRRKNVTSNFLSPPQQHILPERLLAKVNLRFFLSFVCFFVFVFFYKANSRQTDRNENFFKVMANTQYNS